MEIIQALITKSKCYQSARKIKPRGIMIHSLGVPQPSAKVILKNWNNGDSKACAHYLIDGVSANAYQALPDTWRAWHCGRSGNDTHISIEICEPAGFTYKPNSSQMVGYDPVKHALYFERVYRATIELCAILCKRYGLTEKDVLCHAEGYRRGIASNHGDVLHWFPKHGKNMDTFRRELAKVLCQKPDKPKKEEPKEEAEMRYEKITDVPTSWGGGEPRETIKRLMRAGIVKGDTKGVLDLSEDMVRMLVMNERGGAYDTRLKAAGL